MSEPSAPAGEDPVFVTAEEKLAIAGNLESAHRALDVVWGLWTERAAVGAWEGQYWDHCDVADLERLTANALNAIEASWLALTTALAATQALAGAEEP